MDMASGFQPVLLQYLGVTEDGPFGFSKWLVEVRTPLTKEMCLRHFPSMKSVEGLAERCANDI